jgi:hypothetical protein
MFLCLAPLTAGLLAKIKGLSSNAVVALGSFGYHAHGSFHVTTETVPPSNLSFFLPTESEYMRAHYGAVQPSQFCQFPLSYAALNITGFSIADRYTWSGAVPADGVYIFTLINCVNATTEYSVAFDLRNPESFLDARTDTFPLCFLVFAVVHAATALLWLANLCRFSAFAIDLTMGLALLPAVRALAAALGAAAWRNQQCNFPTPALFAHARFALTTVYVILLLALSALIVGGWCLYRPCLAPHEFLEVFLSAAATVLAARCFDFLGTGDGEAALMLFLAELVSVIWFAKVVLSYVLAFVKLIAITAGASFARRLVPIKRFLVLAAGVAVGAVMAAFCASLAQVSVASEPWVVELAIALVHGGQFVVFRLSRKVEGDSPEAEPGAALPRVLSAPGGEELVILA